MTGTKVLTKGQERFVDAGTLLEPDTSVPCGCPTLRTCQINHGQLGNGHSGLSTGFQVLLTHKYLQHQGRCQSEYLLCALMDSSVHGYFNS